MLQKAPLWGFIVSIPVCLGPHTSQLLPSLESLYSSAAETHRHKLRVGRKFSVHSTKLDLWFSYEDNQRPAAPADGHRSTVSHPNPTLFSSVNNYYYYIKKAWSFTSWMAVMTTCCTDSSIIIMVWMYSGEIDNITSGIQASELVKQCDIAERCFRTTYRTRE